MIDIIRVEIAIGIPTLPQEEIQGVCGAVWLHRTLTYHLIPCICGNLPAGSIGRLDHVGNDKNTSCDEHIIHITEQLLLPAPIQVVDGKRGDHRLNGMIKLAPRSLLQVKAFKLDPASKAGESLQ